MEGKCYFHGNPGNKYPNCSKKNSTPREEWISSCIRMRKRAKRETYVPLLDEMMDRNSRKEKGDRDQHQQSPVLLKTDNAAWRILLS
eukprot:10449310-Ditylum_brightwellii.AAC.1